jgi:hypothetical protein
MHKNKVVYLGLIFFPLCFAGFLLPSIYKQRDGIFKLLRSTGIDSDSIPPAMYVAWRARLLVRQPIPTRFLAPLYIVLKFQYRMTQEKVKKFFDCAR